MRISGTKDESISREGEFLCLQELYKAAQARLSRETWDYLMGGAETETTLRRNRQALDSIAFRPRVLRNVSRVSAKGRLLGVELRAPVLLAPIGGIRDLDPGGAATAARAASDFGTASMHSSVSKPSLEEIAAAGDGPKIYQLYMHEGEDWLHEHATRAVAAGYCAFCLTVDAAVYSRRERDIAKRYTSTIRQLETRTDEIRQAELCWDDVKRFKDRYDIPLVLKGIATAEDARMACEHGVEAIYVSNHGGRSLDHARGTLSVLPEVVAAVSGEAEIIIDGGFLRGTDVVKAIALGADAVGIGKLMGLAVSADGRSGVIRALELLENEIRIALGLLGVTSCRDLDASYVQPAEPVYPAGLTSAFPLLEEGY